MILMIIDNIVVCCHWMRYINVSYLMLLDCYVRLLAMGSSMMRSCNVWVIVVWSFMMVFCKFCFVMLYLMS